MTRQTDRAALAARAGDALEAYLGRTPSTGIRLLEAEVEDLITDLLHLAAGAGCDAAQIMTVAAAGYEDTTADAASAARSWPTTHGATRLAECEGWWTLEARLQDYLGPKTTLRTLRKRWSQYRDGLVANVGKRRVAAIADFLRMNNGGVPPE